jgi:small-conductance mechanosensitive channel
VLEHAHLVFLRADHTPGTLTGNCGNNPGIACRLVWDVSHNGQAAQLTSNFLAGPVHLLLRVIYVVVLALIIRAILHRVINRLSERATASILPQFRNGAPTTRLARSRLIPRRFRGQPSPGTAARAPVVVDSPPSPEAKAAAEADDSEQGPLETAAAAAGVARALVTERREQRVRALGSILRSAASVTIFAIAGVVLLGDIGINLAPLLASAGVVGIAIGFGAQNLVRDYLSGVFMLIEDQYGVGDVISVGSVTGTVETVTLRITRLRDVNGIVWHIRNGTIDQVGNESQGWARAVIDFPVPYTANLSTTRTILQEVADTMWAEPTWHAVMLEEPEVWGAQEVSSTGITMRMVAKTAPLRQWEVAREMRARVKAALDAAGITPAAELPGRRGLLRWHRYEPAQHIGAAQLLPRGRRRGNVHPAGTPLLPGGRRGSGAAAGVPGARSGTGRGAPAAVPHPVLGRTADIQRVARTPAAADAARALPHRRGRTGRLAPPYAHRPRRTEPG